MNNNITALKKRKQTDDEFWRDYDRYRSHDRKQPPISRPPETRSELCIRCQQPNTSEPPDTLTGEFKFMLHKTTLSGRLVMDFVHIETGQLGVMFLNVLIYSLRTGKMYRVGLRGQFTTEKGHRFRCFWMYAIGEEPYRWCKVHTEMHKLQDMTFTGTAVRKYDSKGDSYWLLLPDELRKKR